MNVCTIPAVPGAIALGKKSFPMVLMLLNYSRKDTQTILRLWRHYKKCHV